MRLASRNPLEMDARIGELEKTHGMLFLEKALGLLAAILPQDINVSGVEEVTWNVIGLIYLTEQSSRVCANVYV